MKTEFVRKRRFVLLVLLLLGLNALDASLTHTAGLRGSLVEVNPLMARLIEHSWSMFWLAKCGLFAVGLVALLCFAPKYPQSIQKIMVGLIVVFSGVCLVNAWALV